MPQQQAPPPHLSSKDRRALQRRLATLRQGLLHQWQVQHHGLHDDLIRAIISENITLLIRRILLAITLARGFSSAKQASDTGAAIVMTAIANLPIAQCVESVDDQTDGDRERSGAKERRRPGHRSTPWR